MRNTSKAIGIGLLLLLGITVRAQDRDFLSWNAIELGYEPSKKWDFQLEAQLRLKDDFSTIDEYFGQFQVNRRIAKGLKLGVAVRYAFENDDQGRRQGIENHFRHHFDVRYRTKLDRFTLRYRIRYQNKNELGVDDQATRTVRLKTGVAYNIRRWKLDPYVNGELFNRLQSDEERKLRFRVTLGTSYNLKKAGKIGAYYRVQSSFNEEARGMRTILGLKYSYTIK